MQYLLTEEEYQALKTKQQHDIKLSNDKLQALCTKIANEMPVLYWNNKEPEIWGCILTEEYEHYCDECPVQKICPNLNKGWSK